MFVIALSFAAAPAAAQGPEAHEVDLPFAQEMLNPCNGNEPVTIEGTLKVLAQSTNDQAGGIHLKLYTTSRGQGVGLFNTYVYSEEEELEFYDGSSGTAVFTSVLNHLLTSASAADNFYMKILMHTTIANGVLTAEVDETTVECRG
jgi:hypothetical protein